MATSVGQIGLDLVVNENQFKKQMAGIGGLAKKAGAALAGAFAIKKLVDFGKESIELGSRLAEVDNVIQQAIPSMEGAIDSFAKSSIQNFGMSETAAKRYVGVFASMSRAFGFAEKDAASMGTTLTGLAADVASFYDTSQDEAFTKLKSVFTGETETLKDLGVVMTQAALDAYAMENGFGRTTKAMSEAEKVALRYAFVQEKLRFAQGDFARTSGSWANQVRILSEQFNALKATIGQGLINLFTPIIQTVNKLIGKLAVLANAFKSFTELITGNKSSGSSGVGAVAAEAAGADDGLTGAAESADNLADNTTGVGKAAKKAAKDMKALMGFDSVNKLADPTEASGDSGDSGSAAPGAGTGSVGGMDFGNLAQGETVVDKMDSKMSALINRCKELASLFKTGFTIGFGDSGKRIEDIKKHLSSIGTSLKSIFTDPKVVASFDNMLNAIALNLGKFAGSLVSVGITIATNLIGGVDGYLKQNKEFIKNNLVSMFDATAEIANLAGSFAVALADIFTIFASPKAKQITTDLIGIFTNGFLGIGSIAMKFGGDVIGLITQPIVDNKDKIKTALSNIMTPISTILSTLNTSVKTTFNQIGKMYDQHIKPMIDSFKTGISELVGAFLDGFNTHIAPVLADLGKKFDTVWRNNIQPALNGIVGLIGKLATGIKDIWEKTLQPFIAWIIETIMPILAPIIKTIGTLFLNIFGTIGDTISDVVTALGGLIDFVVGVFTGDWKKAWNGVKTFFTGMWNGIKTFLSGIWTAIKGIFAPVGAWFIEKFKSAWTGIVNIFKGAGGWFGARWTDIRNAMSAVGTWFIEKFKSAWNGIVNIFKGIGGWFGDRWTDITTKLSAVGTWFKDKFTTAWSNVSAPFKGAGRWFGDVWKSIKNSFGNIAGWFRTKFSAAWAAVKKVFSSGGRIFSGIKDGILNGLKAVINALISGINTIISVPFSGINAALSGLRGIDILGAKPFSWMPSISTPQIPYLAQGGFVEKNTPQLAMIGDNLHQGEVVAPENKLREMAADAVKMAMGSGNGLSKAEMESIMNNVVMRIIAAFANMGFYIDGERLATADMRAKTGINRRYNGVEIV